MIHWTEQELEQMGYPSPADLERAEELSRSDKLIALLWLAGIVGVVSGVVVWDEARMRYASKGRAIKWPAIWKALDKVREVGKSRVTVLSEQLAAKTINLDRWLILVRDEVKTMHTLAAGIAQGGVAQMSPADLFRLQRLTKEQYGFLQSFHMQLADGTQPFDGRFVLRTKMYIDASHRTASETQRDQMAMAGFEEEKNIIEEGENCEGCLDAEGQGWVDIGTLSSPGERECVTNCRCFLDYRRRAA